MQKAKNVFGVQFMVVGNPSLSAEAIEEVLSADGVVLVAKQEYGKRESVYQMKVQFNELKKTLAAVVVTNTDGIV